MDVVVIGNGVAGNSAAKGALRQPDARVVLIDGDGAPYHSACVLPDYLSGDIPLNRVVLEDHQSRRLERRPGARASAIDLRNRQVLLVDGSTLRYDRLILATGSTPGIPPVEGSGLPGNFTLKTLEDATQIRQQPIGNVVVVGSGLIGIEAAVALRKRGHAVILMEALDRIGPRILDPVASEKVQQILESQGIHVRLEESVVAVHGANRVDAVETRLETLKANLVIWATGMKPNSGLAQGAGIAVGKQLGILVKESMQTSAAEVYAAGDVTEYPDPLFSERRLNLFWYFGFGQGRVAGMNAAGLAAAFPPTLQMGTALLFGTPLFFVGYTQEELRERGLFPETSDAGYGRRFFHQVFLDGRLVGVQMMHPNGRELCSAGNVLKIARDRPMRRWGAAVTPWN